MRIYLGLTENSAPHQTRIFGDFESQLIDLSLAYAGWMKRHRQLSAAAYELGSYYFPETIAAFLERGVEARIALDNVIAFARNTSTGDLRGPAGEKILYQTREIRLLPPLQNPEKSFVIGYSDRARTEVIPTPEIPTGFYKLPQTFVTTGAPIIWPKFSTEIDADACLAIVIGKEGRRIAPEKAWEHVGGVTLLIDITAREINKREGATTNNLLGKNFPSSTSLGPAVRLADSNDDLKDMAIDLSIEGATRQQFTIRECVFSVEQIIARWSILGIKPGDFFAIGASMARRGDRLQEPAPLRVGSTIRCSSSTIGELTHKVVAATGAQT
ncbi:MAG: fumarylacetoacetate hydrolase family protein [Deltaproteobacteria bacterium]|nr:fumarylacetoacetate hydrolase family protein [Deltaproteobacteria bacterium]